jgi:hypothetical protein
MPRTPANKDSTMKLQFHQHKPLTPNAITEMSREIVRLAEDLRSESVLGTTTPRLVATLAALRHLAHEYCERATSGMAAKAPADAPPTDSSAGPVPPQAYL